MMISPFVFAIMTLSSLMVCLVMMDLGTPVISATRADSCEIRTLVWSFILPYVVIARGRKVVVSFHDTVHLHAIHTCLCRMLAYLWGLRRVRCCLPRMNKENLKLVLLTLSLTTTALFSGTIFGWAALQIILEKEGLYGSQVSHEFLHGKC
jgi:hypothetical protein